MMSTSVYALFKTCCKVVTTTTNERTKGHVFTSTNNLKKSGNASLTFKLRLELLFSYMRYRQFSENLELVETNRRESFRFASLKCVETAVLFSSKNLLLSRVIAFHDISKFFIDAPVLLRPIIRSKP